MQRRPPQARDRLTCSPRARAAPTNTRAGYAIRRLTRPLVVQGASRRRRWIAYSSSCSLSLGKRRDHGDEEVGDAGRAHFAQGGEALTIDAIKHQNTAAHQLALVDRFESPSSRELVRAHGEFRVARLKFFHCAREHDSPLVEENQVSEDVLNLIDLVRGDNDGAVVIVVVVQYRIV